MNSPLKLKKNILLIMGSILIMLILAIALFGKQMLLHDPYGMDLAHTFLSPGKGYPFGTDHMGRCIYSRVLEGTRETLMISCAVVVISAFVGTLIGVISGWRGGKTDIVLMRIVDVFMAFPTIIFTLAVSSILGTGEINLIIAITCISWTKYARFARGETIILKNEEYNEAARAMGNGIGRIMYRYILPNIAARILVMMSQGVGHIILYCASLSFLGLGAQPPSAEWGAMINEGRNYMLYSPWISLFPGLAIAISSIAFNLFGDGLRDYLDPHMKDSPEIR